MTVAKQFGANLAARRKDAGLSQEELAWGASVHRTEISQLERGLRIPRIDTLVKLATTVGIKPEVLLAGIVWTPGNVRLGRFVEAEVPGLGTVHRRVRVERQGKE
ncbi:MAG TPA: helix-turn-helix transcriptional regulator [Solirubrobacterales bacterium]|jgi:transcriptional regulator with XRE-family HTH domain